MTLRKPIENSPEIGIQIDTVRLMRRPKPKLKRSSKR